MYEYRKLNCKSEAANLSNACHSSGIRLFTRLFVARISNARISNVSVRYKHVWENLYFHIFSQSLLFFNKFFLKKKEMEKHVGYFYRVKIYWDVQKTFQKCAKCSETFHVLQDPVVFVQHTQDLTTKACK